MIYGLKFRIFFRLTKEHQLSPLHFQLCLK